ncbi:dioxygenase family protein [Neisseria elongata]|uniref:dioxygenase family protein n=1 Tax=Neisseria elongata TaxID=495 RepID=UPI0024B12097|nr:class III extradiol ring-cleavage dioxygenase [Neisseria elongata]
MNKMPVLFVGHGSPMNALDAENPFNQGFRRIAQKFAKPKAILMISAHWYGNRLQVTSGERPEMIYDFYGFPAALSQVQYPAPGSPELAGQVRSLLQPENVETNPERGFDHGAWAVLKHLYPEADIPVVQLSLNLMQPAQWHFDLAKKLTPLREQGVLVVGSGKVALQHAVRGVGNDGELRLGYGAVGGKYGIERGVLVFFARQQQRWRLDVGEIGAAHAEAVLQARPHRGDARTFAEEEAEQDVHLAQRFEETAVA